MSPYHRRSYLRLRLREFHAKRLIRFRPWLLLGFLFFVNPTSSLCQVSEADEKSAAAASAASPSVRTDSLGDVLPRQALYRFGTRRFQHPGSVTQLILSKDEKIVGTLDDSQFIAWDTSSGKELWRESRGVANNGIHVGAAGYGIRVVTLQPETGQFVTAEGRGTIAFWDVQTGETRSLTAKWNVIGKSIDVSSDGQRFAIGDAQQTVVFARSGKQMYAIANDTAAPMNQFGGGDRLMFGGDFSYARFSPDGKTLALVNSAKPMALRLFNAASGEPLRTVDAKDRIVRIDFSPDSARIVVSERDNSARLYSVEDGQRIWEFTITPEGSAESYTSDVTFRPDGEQIAVGAPIGPDNTIRLLDPTNGKETAKLTGSGWKPWTLQYTKDSRVLYGAGWDGVIRRWDMNTNEQLPRPGGIRASATCAMSRDGQRLAFVDDAAVIHVVDVATGKTIQQFQQPDTEWEQVVFSHDGRLLAGGGPQLDKVTVVVWDLDSTAKIHEWTWPEGRDQHSGVEALCFSANGTRIAAGVFRQSAAYVWDLPSDKQIAAFRHKAVYGLDLDADGKTLLTAGWDKFVREWDCDSGLQTKFREVTIDHSIEKGDRGDDTRMYGLKLSNDQSLIATVDMTGSIRFFDRELNPVSVINGAGGFTYGALQFSRNDLWVGVGTGDGVKVFDVSSGDLLWKAVDHEQYIYTVDFGARDRTILSGGSDGVCYLWDLGTGEVPAKDVSLDESMAALTGDDSVAAFHAFHSLLKTPERTSELLGRKAQQLANSEADTAGIRKLIVALGARDKDIVRQATAELSKQGLAAFDLLSLQVESGELSEQKQETVNMFLGSMSRQVQYFIALLTDLKTPGTDRTLMDLRNTCRSNRMKQIIDRSRR